MLINFKENNKIEGSVLTLGNFDGVHIGHKFLIEKMNNISLKRKLKSVLVTFNPHTRYIINSNKSDLKTITDPIYKLKLLEELNIDYISIVEFDLKFSKITYQNFIDQIIFKYNPKILLLGYDNKFGFKGLGTFKSIQEYVKKKSYNVKIEVVENFKNNNKNIKSSIIKDYLLEGNIKAVNYSLGRKFKIFGKVVKGYRLGNALGFPTANLYLENKQQIIPKVGVYYVNFRVGINNYKSLCNIGFRPTFKKDKKLSIETHILNVQNIDLYDKYVEIEFIDFIREEKKFLSKKLLVNQINKDISLVNKIN